MLDWHHPLLFDGQYTLMAFKPQASSGAPPAAPFPPRRRTLAPAPAVDAASDPPVSSEVAVSPQAFPLPLEPAQADPVQAEPVPAASAPAVPPAMPGRRPASPSPTSPSSAAPPHARTIENKSAPVATSPASAGSQARPISPGAPGTPLSTGRPVPSQAQPGDHASPSSPSSTSPSSAAPRNNHRKSQQSAADQAKVARIKLFKELNQIRLELVLDALGAESNQDGDRTKWKLPGVGNIWYTGKIQAWKNLNTEHKGSGGVSLVSHARNVGADAAAAWMVEQFGEHISEDMRAAATGDEVRKEFIPPNAYGDALPQVLRYLTGNARGERGLPVSLIESEIAKGNIYATHPENRETGRPYTSATNCVFLAPVSAELRGTQPDGFKGTCEGADPDISGYRVAAESAVAEHVFSMTEAAIDALSYRALFPGRFAFSTNGINRFFLQFRLALEAVGAGYGVRMAFDADTPGDVGSQRLFNAFYLRTALSHSLKVSPETIDEWVMEGDIELSVGESPHELYLREVSTTGRWQQELPVHVSRQAQDADGRLQLLWEPSPDAPPSPPLVRFVARKDLHEKLRTGEHVVPVSAKGFAAVTSKYNLRRDRPVRGKDWNNEINQLGSPFLDDYERCAREGFRETPALPAHLQALRESTPVPDVLLDRLTTSPSSHPSSVSMASAREPDMPSRVVGFAGRRMR